MSIMYYLYLVLLLLSFTHNTFARNEAKHWYFGRGTVMTFTPAGPVVESGKPCYANEGTAAISDRHTGDLLFYTDGITVWDATDTPMPNGHDLHGDLSSTQSALIVPMPGDDSTYYLFTTNALEPYAPKTGLNYSIVDMRLNNGRGDVVVKNVQLLQQCSEKLTGVPHCNGRDFWILTCHTEQDIFYSFLLTDSGMAAQGVPRISHPGTRAGSEAHWQGYMKASPDGRMIAMANARGTMPEGIYLFDFNNSTGALCNARVIDTVEKVGGYYGLSFSPDNTKLYVTGGRYFGYGWALSQYTVTSSSLEAIRTSKVVIGEVRFSQLAMQIGPDGKIYIPGEEYIEVIHHPNAAGTDCQYVREAIAINPEAGIGLPNFMDYLFNTGRSAPSCPVIGMQQDVAEVCAGQCIAVGDTSSGELLAWHWSFPGGTPSSFEGRYPPPVCYDTAGKYDITLQIEGLCDLLTTSSTVLVHESGRLVATIPDTAGTPGTTLLLPLRGTAIGGGTVAGKNLVVELRFHERVLDIQNARPGSVRSSRENGEWVVRISIPEFAITTEGILAELECLPLFSSLSETPVSVRIVQQQSACGTTGEQTSATFRIENYCLGYDLARFSRMGITLFPVPAREVLHVSLSNAAGKVHARLLDPFGRVVAECMKDHCTADDVLTMDTQQCAAGVYILEVHTQQGTEVSAVRVMH